MDLALIQSQIHEHGFWAGLFVGTLVPTAAAKAIPAATAWVIRSTAVIVPPTVAAVRRCLTVVLLHPLARAIIVKNKDAILKLEDAILGAVTEINKAVDAAFDAAIEEASKDEAGAAQKPPTVPEPPKP